MPIHSYHGTTLVCFIDISGFKRAMRNRGQALRILELFYQTGYVSLRVQSSKAICLVEGVFITDCAILFVRQNQRRFPTILRALLQVVEAINKEMIRHNVMLTTSIAYGHFAYEPRMEFDGIEKNIVFGDAYISAYLDNSVGTPKLTPGLCRVIVDGLPQRELERVLQSNSPLFQLLRQRTENHLYFYWMLNNPRQINRFERNYASPLGIPDYNHVLDILKKSCVRKG